MIGIRAGRFLLVGSKTQGADHSEFMSPTLSSAGLPARRPLRINCHERRARRPGPRCRRVRKFRSWSSDNGQCLLRFSRFLVQNLTADECEVIETLTES